MTVAERDALADDYALRYGQLATLLADGAITFAEWQRFFSDLLVELIAAGYVAGRGGLERMADADWLIVATIVKDQHAYFDGFRQDIQSRIDDRAFGVTVAEILNASQAYIGQRSALYAGASVNAYEQGKTAEASEGKGVLVLPVYPADGGSSCGANCLPGHMLVQAPELSGAFRRWFDGEIITIDTASGNQLAVTPHHPVLTPRGFIPAQFLNHGDEVISARLSDRLLSLRPHIDHRPTPIAEVFDSVRNVWKTQRVMGSTRDFYGDGRNCEVDIVLPRRKLTNYINSSVAQPFRQFALSNPNFLRRIRELAFSIANASIHRDRLVTSSFMRSLNQVIALFLGQPLPAQQVGFASGPWGNPHQNQSAMNRRSSNSHLVAHLQETFTAGKTIDDLFVGNDRSARFRSSDFDPTLSQPVPNTATFESVKLRNGIDRFAREVATDNIIDIRIDSFHGYVYDLQTEPGWFISSNLIIHNCRCSWDITSDDENNQWIARWSTQSDARVCSECEERGMLYAHFVVPYDTTITPEAEIR